jgi:hypothetical protein
MPDHSAGLHEWARRHARQLAGQFVREDRCERGDPIAYFERNASSAGLLPSLRTTAEPAFMERILELEAAD